MILNNLYLGMVRQWQELFYEHNYSGVYLGAARKEGEPVFYPPDFVKLCEAYGAKGFKILKKEDVRGVIEQAIAHPGPVIMDFWVEEEENCWPMIPAGAGTANIMGQPREE